MKSKVHDLRVDQDVSIEFMARILSISVGEYLLLEGKPFSELTQYERETLSRLLGVDEADLQPRLEVSKDLEEAMKLMRLQERM